MYLDNAQYLTEHFTAAQLQYQKLFTQLEYKINDVKIKVAIL